MEKLHTYLTDFISYHILMILYPIRLKLEGVTVDTHTCKYFNDRFYSHYFFAYYGIHLLCMIYLC